MRTTSLQRPCTHLEALCSMLRACVLTLHSNTEHVAALYLFLGHLSVIVITSSEVCIFGQCLQNSNGQ